MERKENREMEDQVWTYLYLQREREPEHKHRKFYLVSHQSKIKQFLEISLNIDSIFI